MNKIIFLILLVTLCFLSSINTFGISVDWRCALLAHGEAITVDLFGNIYAIGYMEDTKLENQLNNYNFIIKFDTNAKRVWTVKLRNRDSDNLRGITVDSSGNVYVTGNTKDSLDGNINQDIFITKFDTNGKQLWKVQFGTREYESSEALAVDFSGNIYVTGVTKGSLDGNTNQGGRDIFITKYDTNGKQLWTVQPGSREYESSEAIAVDSLGNIYVTGGTFGRLDGNINQGGRDIFITKYNTNGTRLWTIQPGTRESEGGNAIAVDSSRNMYVACLSITKYDNNITKYDTNGKQLWTVTVQPSSRECDDLGITVDSSGNVYVIGGTNGSIDETHPDNYNFINKYDIDGKRLWTIQMQRLGHHSLFIDVKCIIIDSSGNGYVLISERESMPEGYYQERTYWFIKKFKANLNEKSDNMITDFYR